MFLYFRMFLVLLWHLVQFLKLMTGVFGSEIDDANVQNDIRVLNEILHCLLFHDMEVGGLISFAICSFSPRSNVDELFRESCLSLYFCYILIYFFCKFCSFSKMRLSIFWILPMTDMLWDMILLTLSSLFSKQIYRLCYG